MKTQLEAKITNYLSQAGYSESQITAGMGYADSVGYTDIDEAYELAISRILYSDTQLNDGATPQCDCVDWDQY